MSFARLPNRRGGRNDAQSELVRAYAQFQEGYDTADLRSAKLLLDKMGQSVAC
jgi:hypothetical protein